MTDAQRYFILGMLHLVTQLLNLFYVSLKCTAGVSTCHPLGAQLLKCSFRQSVNVCQLMMTG